METKTKKEPNIKCDQCGVEFYKGPHRIKIHKNHYCTVECKRLAQIKKEIVICNYCNIEFLKDLNQIKRSIKHYCSVDCQKADKNPRILVNCAYCNIECIKTNFSVKKNKNNFCSIDCANKFQTKKIIIQCAYCGKNCEKKPSEILNYKNNFCSLSCTTKHTNQNKKWGFSRSKLEIYLEEEIKNNFNDLEFLCNERKLIGLELDFYFPKLDLAVEINGPIHTKPIYGELKFEQTKIKDAKKIAFCNENNIDLKIIDSSDCKHLTDKFKDKFRNLMFEYIEKAIKQKTLKEL